MAFVDLWKIAWTEQLIEIEDVILDLFEVGFLRWFGQAKGESLSEMTSFLTYH